jgi:hypothetical protein
MPSPERRSSLAWLRRQWPWVLLVVVGLLTVWAVLVPTAPKAITAILDTGFMLLVGLGAVGILLAVARELVRVVRRRS